jgi:hypothetical protein
MEMAMCRLFYLISCVLAALTALGACGSRLLPATPAGLAFQPGRYVKESYFAPDFKPVDATYAFNAFTVTAAREVPAEEFLELFREELVRAWRAQGLRTSSGKKTCRLSGTIHHLSVKGARFRFLTGRLHATIALSGTITRGEQVLFTFRDQINMSSPQAPGSAAPQEKILLLRQLARETVHHLLNELLLHGPTDDSG